MARSATESFVGVASAETAQRSPDLPRTATIMTSVGACSADDTLVYGGAWFAFSVLTFALSRTLSPKYFPATYSRVASEPGGRGYWDSSVASLINGVLLGTAGLGAFIRSSPVVMGSDFYAKTSDSCRVMSMFTAWISFEFVLQLVHWGQWKESGAMLVHHVSALTAWVLYMQGGYAHALSLIGCICEYTNPFMNIRYFLLELQLKESKAYMANGLAFLLAWLVIRIGFAPGVGGYMVWLQWAQISALPLWRSGLLLFFFGVGCCLNCMWGYKLLRGALKILFAGEHPKEGKES